ncbi:retrovirus-related pol polyprotein from transposon TNT 1-94, partial [Tanacetum coccineum]
MNVVFYEHIFPYSKTSVAQVLQPISAHVSSPIWYEDFVSTTQPLPQASAHGSPINVYMPAYHVTELAASYNEPISEPEEAIKDADWFKAMNDELRALEENATWEHTPLPKDKKRKCIDYEETFGLVAKMVTVIALLAIAAMKGCDTCQMDVSNAFLHGDLFKDIYMQMPQR